VKILGGLVDVTEEASEYSFSDGKSKISGRTTLVPGGKLSLQFNGGKFEFKNSADNVFAWECSGTEGDRGELATGALNPTGAMSFDFRASNAKRCRLDIPAGTALDIDARSGKIELAEPNYSVKATLASGTIEVDPSRSKKYAYDLHVTNGRADQRASDPQPDHRLELRVGNGRIELD
jgi:hypothetical protein